MRYCDECLYFSNSIYDSSSCLRYPPVPIYQRVEWRYGEPVMGIQAEYPTVYKGNLACGEFKERGSNE